LGFAGYKVGTTHLVLIDNKPKSPLFGREVMREVTVVEVPPVYVFGLRAYVKSPKGLRTLGEAWAKTLPKFSERAIKVSKDYDPAKATAKIEARLKDIAEIRAFALTQPQKTGIGKKNPDFLEIKVGGDDVKSAYEYAKGLIGKEVKAKDLFSEGSIVDATGISKGKGFAGAVKRFGVKYQPNWHKHRKGHKVVGAISPSRPHMMFTIPRPGKMGFHQRTEYNKLILKVGENPAEINVSGGFLHYGLVKADHMIIAGTLPGPTKRLIRFKAPVRAKSPKVEVPKIVAISLASKQGV
jgi:large subunit ribosomal protein L3